MKAMALFTSPMVAVFAMIFGVVVVLTPAQSPPALGLSASSCVPQVADATSSLDLDAAQQQVVHTVIRVGKSLNVPARGWVIALTAGLQESGLRPLRHGDRDSLGVFQQRAAWGSANDRINPETSTYMFFAGGQRGQRGLMDVPGWTQMPVAAAAQEVEVSAYPDAYAKWESLATKLVQQVTGIDATCRPAGAWVLPVGRAHYTLTAGFGDCGALWAHCHTGQDFAVPTGTPVVAASQGLVTFTGRGGPYGNVIHILHADGVATWYGHLSEIRIQRGATVSAGNLIGLSGSTGNTTGPHLHFEVRTGATEHSDGDPIDPLPWLHQRNVL